MSLYVIHYAVLALDCVSRRGDCVGSLRCILKLPLLTPCCPPSLILITLDLLLLLLQNFLPCNSPTKIEFYIKKDFLRVLSVCPTCFPNDPQAFFYNLPVGEPTAQIKILING